MRVLVIDWSYYDGPVPGYGECRPDGGFACLMPERHVLTHHGPVALPGEDVTYLHIPEAGERVAGGGHGSDRTKEWNGQEWQDRGWFYGPNAAIYGVADHLVQVESREQYGVTNGWRYLIDGIVIDCVSTYADKTAGVYEFSRWSDVTIGQGGKPDMGCVVALPTEKLRRLDPRPEGQRSYPFNARFIRVRRGLPLDFAITIVDLGARKTYFVWCTWQELYALPFVDAAVPPPAPPPKPTPKPEPPVSDDLTVPASGQTALRRLAEMFPALIQSTNDDERRQWIRKAAEQMAFTVSPDWGTKNAGGGRPPSKDALARIIGGVLYGWDIVNGSTRELNFGEGEPLPGQEFIAVGPVNHIGGQPGPTPPAGNTHRYIGGGNDTGTCDQCGQPRVSDVHRVPEGRVPHAAWLGEDGKGDCDLCFQAVDAAIHRDEPNPGPQPPSGDLEQRVAALEAWRAEIGRVS